MVLIRIALFVLIIVFVVIATIWFVFAISEKSAKIANDLAQKEFDRQSSKAKVEKNAQKEFIFNVHLKKKSDPIVVPIVASSIPEANRKIADKYPNAARTILVDIQ